MNYLKSNFLLAPNKNYLEGKAPQLQILFIWLCEFTDQNNQCFPTIKTLCEKTGMARRTVIRYLQILQEDGVLKIYKRKTKQGDFTSNLYEIMMLKTGGNEANPEGGSVTVTPPVVSQWHSNSLNNLTLLKKEKYKKEKNKKNSEKEKQEKPSNLSPGLDKFNKFCNKVFNIWKDIGITKPRSLTNSMIKSIKSLLTDMGEDDIIRAIQIYGKVFKSEKTWYTWRWTLEKFLRQSNGLREFEQKKYEDYLSNDGQERVRLDEKNRKARERMKEEEAEKVKEEQKKNEQLEEVYLWIEEHNEEWKDEVIKAKEYVDSQSWSNRLPNDQMKKQMIFSRARAQVKKKLFPND